MSAAQSSQGSNPWLIALTVTLAAFMEVLDTTIVNVALPHIAGTLSASNDQATWAITAYLVANGIVLPVSGWLSSVFGRKRYFLACIIGFGAFSLACGVAQNMPQLIVFRVFQGLCGGGLQPSQQAILLDTFSADKRGQAFSVAAIATVVAPVLGPTLGGWITDSYSWRWIFLINVPVSIFTFFAVQALVSEPADAKSRDRKSALKIDYIGLALIALAFGCLQIALDKGTDYDWLDSNFIRVLLILSCIGFVGGTWWLTHATNPVVKLDVYRNRNFAIGSVMMFVFAGLLYCSAVLLGQLVQQQFRYTATLAGLLISPGALVTIFIIPLVGLAMKKVSVRLLAMTAFFVLFLAFEFSSRLTPSIDYQTLLLMRIAQGVGIALMFSPVSVLATATLRKNQNDAGAALFTMARNLGGSVGISVATAAVTSRTQIHQFYLSQHLSNTDQPYRELFDSATATLRGLGRTAINAQSQAMGQIYQQLKAQSAVLAYADVFKYCAIFALVMVPLGLLAKSVKQKPGAAPGGH